MASDTKQFRKNLRRLQNHKKPRKFLTFLGLVFSFFIFLGSASAVYVAYLSTDLPTPSQLGSKQIIESTKIFDRTGEVLLYEIHGEEKRTVIPFSDIPDYVKQATLAAENANFYTDPAVDIRGIARAAVKNFQAGRVVQGGSTITQQLAKNLFLTPERKLNRKLKELVLAFRLEAQYSKDEIFELYLNQIPYGSNAYGIESASETFFNKHAEELTLGESALLAALPNAPTYYSPWGTHTDAMYDRQHHILDRMEELGYIEEAEAEFAKEEGISFQRNPETLKASHFSLMVRGYLAEKYGEDVVVGGGLQVKTTLDFRLQEIAERVVLENADRNTELYQGHNAALVAQDPKTGQILALVGSKDAFRESEPAGCVSGVSCRFEPSFNVPIQGLRQPGSALKPFAYLTAFEKGYVPQTMVFDTLTEFASANPLCPQIVDLTNEEEACFHPGNFDNVFRGPTTLAEGLAQSINVPSVKALYLAGFDNVLGTLKDFGITTLGERGRYGLSLVLGGGEVRLAELVNAYGTLADEGVRHEQAFILEVKDSSGKTLEKYRDRASRVMSPQYPRMITEVLSDKELRSGLFSSSLYLTLFSDRDVALKTGTTNDFRDAWTMGYTPNLVVGVWAGNNSNEPMVKRGGSILAAVPLWSAFLNEAFQYFPAEPFRRPEQVPVPQKPMLGGQSVYIPVKDEVSYPQIHTILHYVDRDDPLGGFPSVPQIDSQYSNWEVSILEWAKINLPNFAAYNLPVPEGAREERRARIDEDISISNLLPSNGTYIKTPFMVSADIQAKEDLKEVELSFNGKSLTKLPVEGKSFPLRWFVFEPPSSQNTIQITVTDMKGRKERKSVVLYN